jgi:hypothetical protein
LWSRQETNKIALKGKSKKKSELNETPATNHDEWMDFDWRPIPLSSYSPKPFIPSSSASLFSLSVSADI